MTFLKLFQRALVASWQQFLVLATLSGVSNAAVLATINWAAASLADRDTMGHALVVLALAIAVYSISQRALMVKSATLAESTVASIRVRLIEKLKLADLVDVEKLNRSEIYTAVSAE